jgi:uncharacterized protein
MHLSNYIKIYPYSEEPGYLLFFSCKQASTALLKESVLDSIETGTLTEPDKETLLSLGLLVDDINEEKNAMLHILDEANNKSIYFNAIVVLNLNCNLSCRYCYEGTMKGKHYMTRAAADSLIDYITNSLGPDKKNLNIDFYGGEPLLSVGLIKYISKRLKAFSGERNVEYTFTLVTNGTLLTRRIAEELMSLGLKSARITLDGIKENHDKYRPYKNGSGSFDTIIQNIKETCEIIKVGIGGNYNRENHGYFTELPDYLLSEGLTPDNISNIKFDPIMKTHNELSPADFRDGCESINEPWLIEAGFSLREEILKRGFNTYRIRPAPCMVDIRDDYVVNYDGTLYKCPGLIGIKGFEAGNITTGIKDYGKSYDLDFWKNDDCINCEYLPLCFGGCRYMKFIRDGNMESVDCKKPYLDATLEAFIKQDIKYILKPENN